MLSLVVTAGLVNVPVGSLAGAVNVTETPLMGMPDSDTIATSGKGKAVLTTAFCGEPLLTAMV